jgi:hypothetical protein
MLNVIIIQLMLSINNRELKYKCEELLRTIVNLSIKSILLWIYYIKSRLIWSLTIISIGLFDQLGKDPYALFKS